MLHYIRYTPLKIMWRDFRNATIDRAKLGFNPRKCWNLDVHFAEYMLPMLIHFKKQTNGYPCSLTEKKWHNQLDLMIRAFTLLADKFNTVDKEIDQIRSEELEIQKGLKAFAKYYNSLWW